MKPVILISLLFIAVVGAGDDIPPRDQAAVSTAHQWAALNRRLVFDELMPAAASIRVVHPLCRVTTLRSPGSADSFEFALTPHEYCDGKTWGELAQPQLEPIYVQLFNAKLRRPSLNDADTVAAIRIVRRELSAETTEVDANAYLRQNGSQWWDFTDSDQCGCGK